LRSETIFREKSRNSIPDAFLIVSNDSEVFSSPILLLLLLQLLVFSKSFLFFKPMPMMMCPLFEITGVLFLSDNNNDGGFGENNKGPLVGMIVAVRVRFPAGTLAKRGGERSLPLLVVAAASVVSTSFVDRAKYFWVVLGFFRAFLLFDFIFAYNSNTLASSGEENWERMFLVLVLLLLLLLRVLLLRNDFWIRSSFDDLDGVRVFVLAAAEVFRVRLLPRDGMAADIKHSSLRGR
jgi:hypothetical protein